MSLKDRFNHVELNLPVTAPGGRLPNPDKPLLTIDGLEIPGLHDITVTAGPNQFTKVNITFYASVSGVVLVPEKEEDDGTCG